MPETNPTPYLYQARSHARRAAKLELLAQLLTGLSWLSLLGGLGLLGGTALVCLAGAYGWAWVTGLLGALLLLQGPGVALAAVAAESAARAASAAERSARQISCLHGEQPWTGGSSWN